MKKNDSSKKGRVRFPLGVKLSIIIGVIVLASLLTVTVLNSYFIGKDILITAENNNLQINGRSANTVENEFSAIRGNVLQLLDLMNTITGGQNSVVARQAQSLFFERNQNIAAVFLVLPGNEDRAGRTTLLLENTKFFLSNEISNSVINDFILENGQSLNRGCDGESIALNAAIQFGSGVMALILPYNENISNQCCCIIFSSENISDSLGANGINTTFMINHKEDLLFHPDTERVLSGQNMRNHPLVVLMNNKTQDLQDDSNQDISYQDIQQMRYMDIDDLGNEYEAIGAYQRIAVADICIFTSVPLDKVLEGVNTTLKNNLYITAIILFVSIIVILIFSRFLISIHLRRLTATTAEIQDGNFDTPYVNMLSTRRLDEIGVLNQATKDQQEFLSTFAKFTNKGVARAIARKEIDFDPHLKDITVFFSDIRGFTAISDGFKTRFGDESPKHIINFLNDYMSRMVNCITCGDGVIDKFEGDAIMAEWGILRDENLSYESLPDSDPNKRKLALTHLANVKQDALNCIRSVIAMRYALMEYNKEADAFNKKAQASNSNAYKPLIQIGCGINTGRATCGIMGSKDKMEYTAIGDSVNFASRTEASNKACGTDILISEPTYNLLRRDFIRCQENNFTIKEENLESELVVEMIPVAFEVKGKGQQHFYGVVNMPQFDIEAFFKKGNPNFVVDPDCEKALGKNGPKTLNEVRRLLGIPIPNFESVNLNEEENKVQIKK